MSAHWPSHSPSARRFELCGDAQMFIATMFADIAGPDLILSRQEIQNNIFHGVIPNGFDDFFNIATSDTMMSISAYMSAWSAAALYVPHAAKKALADLGFKDTNSISPSFPELKSDCGLIDTSELLSSDRGVLEVAMVGVNGCGKTSILNGFMGSIDSTGCRRAASMVDINDDRKCIVMREVSFPSNLNDRSALEKWAFAECMASSDLVCLVVDASNLDSLHHVAPLQIILASVGVPSIFVVAKSDLGINDDMLNALTAYKEKAEATGTVAFVFETFTIFGGDDLLAKFYNSIALVASNPELVITSSVDSVNATFEISSEDDDVKTSYIVVGMLVVTATMAGVALLSAAVYRRLMDGDSHHEIVSSTPTRSFRK